MAGIILYAAATMIAMDNLYAANWRRMKVSIGLALIGGALITIGMV